MSHDIKFVNDWQYLFKPWALGGRFAAFTFFNLSYMNKKLDTDDLKVGGFTLVILGLGVSIR